MFVRWCINNYYDTLIMNLCKLLEPKKEDKERKTLKHFLKSIENPNNWETIYKYKMKQTRYKAVKASTGETIELDFGQYIKDVLNNMNVQADIDKIEDIHTKLKPIRDKKIAHSTKETPNEIFFSELHNYIEILKEIITKYYRIFGKIVLFDTLENDVDYHGFNITITQCIVYVIKF